MAIPAKPTITPPPAQLPTRGENPTDFSNKINSLVQWYPDLTTTLQDTVDWSNIVYTAMEVEANAAATSAALADKWANQTGAAVDGTEYSAKEYATGSVVDSSKRWATSETEVSGGLKGAKGYSLEAQGYSQDAADSAAKAEGAANTYSSTADGLAATANGEYFTIPAAEASGYLDLYRNDSGVATLVKTSASDVFVDEIRADVDKRTIYVGSVAELRGSEGLSGDLYVQGYYGKETVGGGHFYLDEADTTSADDGGLVIVDAAGNRWKRKIENDTLFDYDFGLTENGSNVPTLNIGASAAKTFWITMNHMVEDGYPFSPVSGNIIRFDKSGSLTKTPTSASTYYIIRADDIDGLELHNPVCIGDLDAHTGTTGEAGICIRFGSTTVQAKNIKIYNPICSKAWADGIYLGNVENCYIENPQMDDCRRQGISVISADGLRIVGGLSKDIGLTNGTPPMFGLDFEPNTPSEKLKNIHVTDFRTQNCQGGGITFVPGLLDETSDPVDIVVENHVDNGSYFGFFAANGNTKVIKGHFRYNSPTFKDTRRTAISANRYNSPRLDIFEPVSINANASGSTSLEFGAAISVTNRTGPAGSEIGNVFIKHPTIIDNRATKLVQSSFYYRNEVTGDGPKNVAIIDPYEISGMLNELHWFWYQSEGYLSDKNRTMRYEAGSSFTVNKAYYYGEISYARSDGTAINITLIDEPNDGPEWKFRIGDDDGQIILIRPAGQGFFPTKLIDQNVAITGRGTKYCTEKREGNYYATEVIGNVT